MLGQFLIVALAGVFAFLTVVSFVFIGLDQLADTVKDRVRSWTGG